jgi:hypothetical protein
MLWVGGGFDAATGTRDGVIRRYDPALGGTPPPAPFAFETHDGPGGGDDEILDLVRDTDGTLYACGYETAAGAQTDLWIRKYGPTGTVLWTRTFGGAFGGNDRAVSLALSATHLYVFGEETSSGTGRDPHVRKYVK